MPRSRHHRQREIMPSKRGRGGGGGASTSTSGAASFTPLADLVPASIPFNDQAQETLEVLRAGQDPGIDALLAALNCGGACDAAGAPYSGKCGCRAAVAGVARSLPSSTAAARGGAGGGAAPRCVRGLAPPPGSHRKVGLWAKPPKAEAEAAAAEEEEEEEVKRRVGESIFFPLLSREVEEKKTQKSQNTLSTNPPPPESRPRGALQPRGHLLRRWRAPVPLRRHGVQAGALRERHWRRERRRRSLAAAAAGRRRLGRRRRRRARVFRPRRRRRRPRPPPPLRIHAGRTRGSLRGSWPSREGPGPRRGRAAGRTGVLQAAAGAARGAAVRWRRRPCAAAAAAAAAGGGCGRGPRRPRRARPLPLPRPLLHRNGLRPLSGSRVVVGPRRGVHGARGARARLGDAGARPGLGRGARVPAR